MGCGSATPVPTATPTDITTVTATAMATATPTQIPIPTATITSTPKPSSTATIPTVPTISVNIQSAIFMTSLCRQVVDGLYNLKKDLGLPEHFMSENPFRQPSDFNPNTYVFTHLKMASGYTLDYVYFNDELGGLPMVYARKTSSAPFKSYGELLQSFGEEMAGERSYGQLRHKYDYLENIQIDKTPESYFEFTVLAYQGDQFYLWWHGLYNDLKVLCDSSDMQYVNADMQSFSIEFPQDVKERVEKIDFSPVVIIGENDVIVRMITFTKWGGFFENVYVMDKDNPMQLLDVKFNPIIEYDCGINF